MCMIVCDTLYLIGFSYHLQFARTYATVVVHTVRMSMSPGMRLGRRRIWDKHLETKKNEGGGSGKSVRSSKKKENWKAHICVWNLFCVFEIIPTAGNCVNVGVTETQELKREEALKLNLESPSQIGG
jgi:hypothetical protein